jgi:2-methylcitrate dehydratase
MSSIAMSSIAMSSIAMSSIPRRSLLAGMAATGFSALARGAAGPQPAAPPSSAAPLADRLAAYAERLSHGDIDAATLEAVKVLVVDSVGCALSAFDERPVQICRDIAAAPGGGPSTIIGTRRRTTPDLAAFANAAAIRYYDLNDVYVGRQATHPSDAIAACFAVAEAEKSSAQDLITAIVLAYEIECRLVDAFDLSARRFDTSVFTLPAAALAAGKLMKLDRERLTQAVNIAVNDHVPLAQTRTQTLSDWKGVADANAVRNGVFAALLARGGLTGPAPVFEGRSGFFQSVTKPVTVDTEAFGGAGRPFRIGAAGLKAYPAQVYTQTAAVAATAVAKEVGDLDRIASIDVATTNRGYVMAGSEPEKWAPDTRDTADHSLPYIVARAMFDGDITNESYAPSRLRDPKILAFMKKIAVKEDPAFATPRGNAPSTRITATLDDGRKVVRQIDDMPGFPGKPMTRADAERKFRGNIARRWPAERVRTALDELWALDAADDVAGLLAKLTA